MEYNPKLARLQSQLTAFEHMLKDTYDILMRTSLENRVAFIKQQMVSAEDITQDVARFDVWFSGKGVYGSQGISTAFMNDTMQALVGMILSSTRDRVRKLREAKRRAEMPKGKFYVTALTHGSFGYELEYKDEQGTLFDDPAIVESIHNTMDVIKKITRVGLDMDTLIKEQPIRMVSNLKDLFTALKKQRSTLRIESGINGFDLDVTHVSQGYDNICLSNIIEKEEEIPATFQGALIESGKFEFTDMEGKLQHGNISEDLTNDAIAELNRKFSRHECKLQVIRRIVSYSSGRKKENIELTGIVEKSL